MPTLRLLIAAARRDQRDTLAAELDADGYDVHTVDCPDAALERLARNPFDLLVLGELQRPHEAPALLHLIRAGRYERVGPDQAIITLGADDEATVMRAYNAGSDHHLSADASYLLVRSVIATVARLRQLDVAARRHIDVGALHLDAAAISAHVDGRPVRLSRTEFQLLATLASDPTKVFTRAEIGRAIGRDYPNSRTVDSHAVRVRRRLADAGGDFVINHWGVGYALVRA